MNLHLKKLKPLLQEFTRILIDPATGTQVGLKNSHVNSAEDIYLYDAEQLCLSFDVEGTDWYGHSVARVYEIAYDMWIKINKAATKYDEKIAGAHWVIKYPPGKTTVNGVEKDNAVVAKEVLAALTSSGSLIIPRWLSDQLDITNLDQPDAWIVELISDSGSSKAAFGDRLNYSDKLMARAHSFAERAVFEGEHGTKAEATSHGDLSLVALEDVHQYIVSMINEFVLEPLLEINFGREFRKAVRIVVRPLTDAKRRMLTELYQSLISSTDGLLAELEEIDRDALRTLVGVPTREFDEEEEAFRQEMEKLERERQLAGPPVPGNETDETEDEDEDEEDE